jgi:serine/threonine protein kinase
VSGQGIDAERWHLLRPWLDEALDTDFSEREFLFARVSAQAPELLSDLRRLLDRHDRQGPASQPVGAALAAPLLDADGEAAAQRDQDRIGQSLGAYNLVRVLGTGGMGVVYLAERSDSGFTQRVALKLVRGTLSSSAARERFERERRILAGLAHPTIAALFEGGQTADGQPYYTMEYVDGIAIDAFCREHALGIAERVGLLIKVAAGLAHAHLNLVVHRDIKPSNVLVTARQHVKLVDFGIAKPLGDTTLEPTLTHLGGGPMTPEYAAPEQFRHQAITVATDIYQFGMLAYRVLSGARPYRADPRDPLAWARAVAEDDPLQLGRAASAVDSDTAWPAHTPQRRWRNTLNGDLDAILRRALAKRPEDRYRSMDALIADLEAWLEGRPVSARRAGTWYFIGRFVARRPWAVGSAVAAAIALIATAAIALHQAKLAHDEAERANAVANFLTGLFQVSDPGESRGERLNANQILERGAQKLDKELADHPLQRARLLVEIGKVYDSLGEYSRSQKVLEQATAVFAQQPDADPMMYASALHKLANGIQRQGRPNEALPILQKEESLLPHLPDGTTRGEAGSRIHSLRALLLQANGDLSGALAENVLGVAAAASMGDAGRQSQASTLNNIGLLQRDLGDYAAAQSSMEKSCVLYAQIFPAGHPRRVACDTNLGVILLARNEIAQAEALLLPAADALRAQYGEKSDKYAIILNTLGSVARRKHEHALALQRYDLSAKAYAESLGDDHVDRAWPLINGAEVMIEQRNFTGALARVQEALDLRKRSLPEDHPEYAHSLDAMAMALLPLGRYTEARDDAARALPVLRAKMPADHSSIVECLYHLGLAEFALGNTRQAQDLLADAKSHAPKAYPPGDPTLLEIQAGIADPGAALQAWAEPK